MTVRPLTSPDQVAAALATVNQPSYLQAWAWGEFQQQFGRRVWRLGVLDGDRVVGAVTLIEHTLILGRTYLYVPHGPVVSSAAALNKLLEALRALGKETGAMYIKIDPPLAPPELQQQLLKLEAGTALQPRYTLLLDVVEPPEELLAKMHQKTRYNIRLAEKRGVTIRWSTSDEDFGRFMALQTATAARQHIRLHSAEYFRLMFTQLRAADMTELAIAEYQGQAIAINQIVHFAGASVFIHGGSADQHKDVMAPFLLQWQSILRARQRGSFVYDFRGIAPPHRPDHKLAGVTRFKLGFGGRQVVYPEARNIILDRPWWLAYRLAKRMKGQSGD